jgi:transposase
MTDTGSIAWLGLDAHSQNCLLAHLDDDGTQRRWWRFPTGAQALQKHVSAIAAPDKRLVLEESNLARWISQLLRPLVQQLVVSDPRHNRLISAHPNKHDQRDAFNLARLFRLGEIKAVWQPQDDQRAFFRTAAQAYEDAVLRQTRLKLQIKSLFQHWGLFPVGSAVYSRVGRQSWLKQLPQEALRQQGFLLYALLDQALQSQSQARRLMVQAGRGFPEIARLRTVPGVGVIGSHLFVAYVAEPTRFTDFAQLTRYCRLAIRDRSSDGKPLGFQQLDRQHARAAEHPTQIYCGPCGRSGWKERSLTPKSFPAPRHRRVNASCGVHAFWVSGLPGLHRAETGEALRSPQIAERLRPVRGQFQLLIDPRLPSSPP